MVVTNVGYNLGHQNRTSSSNSDCLWEVRPHSSGVKGQIGLIKFHGICLCVQPLSKMIIAVVTLIEKESHHRHK